MFKGRSWSTSKVNAIRRVSITNFKPPALDLILGPPNRKALKHSVSTAIENDAIPQKAVRRSSFNNNLKIRPYLTRKHTANPLSVMETQSPLVLRDKRIVTRGRATLRLNIKASRKHSYHWHTRSARCHVLESLSFLFGRHTTLP